ncbi:hypothetical protein ABN028_00045 [Actinopolymorpha sp. B17G11]|uniref:hypothetical protein n=1 Tax=Actinopolymorpha sp. B17G11 TaxID=3160861 RepID=UPI0032E4A822
MSVQSKRWGALAGVAVAMVATTGMAHPVPDAGRQAAGPPPPPGMELQHKSGTLATADHRFGQLACSTGKVILGGGASVRTEDGAGGDGDLKFAALQPFDIGDSGNYIYSANVYAKPGYTKPWALEMWALCGPKPPGYEHVRAAPATGDAHQLSRTVTCPAGKKLLAAGGMLTAASFEQRGRIALGAVRPAANGTSALVTGFDDATDGDPTSQFTLHARGVCVTSPAGHQVVAGAASPLDSTAAKVRRATCSNGRLAYSFGLAKVDPAGHAYVDGATPEQLDTKGFPRRYAVRAEQKAPLQDWSLQAHVICANPLD